MAADYMNTYMLNANIMQVCTTIRDIRFASALGFTFRHEIPVQNGSCFRFSNSMNLASWGENIDITVYFVSDTSTQICIKSECAMPTQIVDWGKNRSNVEKFYTQLASVLAYNQQYMRQPVQQIVSSGGASYSQQPHTAAPQQNSGFKFCSRCGTRLSQESKFCSACGNQV